MSTQLDRNYASEWFSYSNWSVANALRDKLSWCRNEYICQRMKCKALRVDWLLRYVRTYIYHCVLLLHNNGGIICTESRLSVRYWWTVGCNSFDRFNTFWRVCEHCLCLPSGILSSISHFPRVITLCCRVGLHERLPEASTMAFLHFPTYLYLVRPCFLFSFNVPHLF